MAATLLSFVGTAQAAHLDTTPPSCGHLITASQFRPWASRVWKLERWRRGDPKPSTVVAYHRMLRCAVGPGNRQAMQEDWHRKQRAYFAHRHHERYCRSGRVVSGRVSYFGGGLMASGHLTSEPAIALNIDAGTESGWDNPTTRGWVATLQRFRVTIAGHTAVLFDGDLGPAASTYRAIDVTEGGVAALDLSGAFPTDAFGTARLIPPGCHA